ncbi:MAG: hypothetical protein PHT33_07335 [bacterium]|nr:hypothetical protein [bacterium]
MRSLMLLTVLFALLTTVASAEVKYSPVIYPLTGNLKQDEGTIEVWVRPEMDLSAPVRNFYNFSVFRIALGERAWGDMGAFSLFWRPKEGLFTVGSVKGQEPLKNVPSCWPKKMSWEKDTWHHVAFTWKGQDMAIYSDGEIVDRKTVSGPLPFADKGFLVMGFGESMLTLDDLCVSSLARSPEDIKKRFSQELKSDDHTLFIDLMDGPEAAPGGRTINKTLNRFVDGKYGKGIRVHFMDDRQ